MLNTPNRNRKMTYKRVIVKENLEKMNIVLSYKM